MVDNLRPFLVDNLSQFPAISDQKISKFSPTMVSSPSSQRVALGCQIKFQKNMTRENSYQPDTMRSLFLTRLAKSSGVRPTNIE